MKFFLVLCILAAISCNKVIDIIKCITADPSVQGLIMEIIEVIKAKDYLKTIALVVKYFTPIYDAITGCI